MPKVPGKKIHALWSVLWEALPSTSATAALEVLGEEVPDAEAPTAGLPAYLTLDEAAALLKVKPEKMRRLVIDNPRLRAVKVGAAIRIPRSAMNEFIVDPRPAADRRNGPGMTVQEVTAFFRVSQDVIRYAMETGRLKAEQAGRYARVRIPIAEVQRIAKSGLVELKPHKYWHRPEAEEEALQAAPFSETGIENPFIRLHPICGEGNPDLRADRRSERRPALILLGMAGADPSAEAGAGSLVPPRPRGVPIAFKMRGRTASGAHSQERRRGGRLSLPSGVPTGEVLPPGLPGGAIARSVAKQRSEPDSETAVASSRPGIPVASSESCRVPQPMETPRYLPRMSRQTPAKAATK